MMYTAVIADDEKIEQKVIQKILQEFCPKVKVMSCVSNGMKLVESVEALRPDIIIVDINMPVMNGLDALEILRLKKITAKIIVVTAYSKFEFAKKALSFGAEEYILKPVNEQALVDAVNKICMQLDAEKKSSKEKEGQKEYRKMLERELISEMLLGEISTQNCEKYRELSEQPMENVCTAVLRGEFQDSEETILEHLKRFCLCFGKMYKESLVICMFLPEVLEGGYKVWINEVLECMKVRSEKTDWSELVIGISACKTSLEELVAGVKESQMAIREMRKPGIYFFEEDTERAADYSREVYECQECLRQEKTAAFQSSVHKAFQKFDADEMPAEFLRTFAWRIMMDGNQQKEYSFLACEQSWNYWERMLQEQESSEIKKILLEWGIRQEGHKKEIAMCDDYIREGLNYMGRYYMNDLSLNIVAKAVNISSFYFSRLFKKNMKRTFMEVLTDIRFIYGINFLYEGKMTTQQISLEIGYQNVSYFYRLFRKKMGMTTGEMKNYLQLL